MNELLQARAQGIQLLVLDVDGVLTDGKLYFGVDGEALKSFNTLDGHGLKLLAASGVKVAIITGRESPMVARRAANLGITRLKQGREDKFAALQELLAEEPCPLHAIACMGDDYPDLAIMVRVGLALAPPNACEEVRTRAHWISSRSGGEGAVRDACDLIMRAQGTFAGALAPYLG
ncbi:MAG: phenylphosphate carboxylase subunit delta [Moraxellaceae bacterium]|jgi:3-deoxy-D-manno-octulosonate 8-phosphate phosphatase (KDO 8-P phosphatase)|nr:MAG: phenylphosphate carboxylase subunit delta [Moraxellaceae bacterium]